MAPGKKSKSINKGFAGVYDTSSGKDEKSKQKKRKCSDMIGHQWSKVELQRFYDAYRKYGKDWKKVACFVRSRSPEMVEALHNMNRAYLSLPEGTASVSGLIAMMTDHYNVQDGSGSEKDTEDKMPKARKVQKYQKVKGRLDSKSEVSLQRQTISSSDKSIRGNSLQRRSISSSDRCPSLLTMFDVIQPNIPVRKRTPRVPVSCLDSRPKKKPRESVMNGNNGVLSHGPLSLTEARQDPSSAHDTQTTHKRFEHLGNSQASAREKPKNGGFAANQKDDSLGSYETRIEKKFKDSMDSGFALTDNSKGEKGKKKEVEILEATMHNDIQDTRKLIDKGPRIKGSFADEGARIGGSPSDSHRKISNESICEDEQVACDALQTLAEMSLRMPNLDQEPAEDARESVTVRDTTADTDGQLDVARQEASPVPPKKRKSQAPKVQKVELHIDHSRKHSEKETLADEEVKSRDSNAQICAASKQFKSSARSPDVSLSNGHLGETEVAVSSTPVGPVQASSCGIIPTRRKCRRKRDRTDIQKDRNHAPSAFSSKSSSLFQDRVQCAKDKISHCLSWPDVRRWCAYEWFYSAIDYPWFAKQEFVEYLNHVGLGHIPRLTRVEWGVIRSSLGKPRRFSERFLQEEREKLKQYRESVRTHYANLRAGLGEGLPTDLARPLSVGQQVIAIHPKTRELHNGSVLAVDRHSYLVQFESRDLGVEFVLDIDCMPLNPVENMPESRRRHKMLFDHQNSQLPKVNGNFNLASDENVQNLDSHLCLPPFNPATTNDMKVRQCLDSHKKVPANGSLRTLETTQSPDMTQMQQRQDNIKPLQCLTQDLDKKVYSQQSGSPFNAPWPHPVTSSGGVNGTLHSSKRSMFSREETSPNVVDIVQGSRDKAQKMVDVAVKIMSSMREGEDSYGRIDEAYDTSVKSECVTDCRPSTVQRDLPPQNSVPSCSSEPHLTGRVSSGNLPAVSGARDLQVPSELITSCVATLLMIQTCTERQYPPSEVAQILDNAVTSLHPRCSQNLSVYREIQMCMGRIKTQILALVPT